jgi:hypothetical protein
VIGHQSLELLAGVLTAAIGVMQQRVGFTGSFIRGSGGMDDFLVFSYAEGYANPDSKPGIVAYALKGQV